LKESETIEFKKSTSELKEAVISMAAMLNKQGYGTVYFGISDNGTIYGQMTGRETLQVIVQAFVDNVEPKIYPTIEVVQVEGKECIVAKAKGINSPYFAYGRAYIRVGESDKRLSASEIESRILTKKRVFWEKEQSTKQLTEINEEAVKGFVRKAQTAQRIDFEYIDVRTTLNKLHLLEGEHLTMAAEVLFCDDNQMEIQAATFAGNDKLTFLDIKQFKGTLFSLRKQAELYINANMRWRADLSESSRKEIPEIPLRAISEAIGNSLCHRDYSNPKGNEVAIFKNRIEIYNPGLFPEGIEPEDFFTGHEHSVLRNPLIAETMFRSRDIERWGSGIKRIHDECTETGIKVEFIRRKTGFVVSFYRLEWAEESENSKKTTRKTTQKTAQKIILLLKENPKLGRKEIAELLGEITEYGVKYHLEKLRREGHIKRIGPAKGGFWQIISEP
jgi:ATP-dependent DNA helicase RecG